MSYPDYTEPEVKTARYAFPVTGYGTALRLRRQNYGTASNLEGAKTINIAITNQGNSTVSLSFVSKGTITNGVCVDPESNAVTLKTISLVARGYMETAITVLPTAYILECQAIEGMSTVRCDMSSKSRWDVVPLVRGDSTVDDSTYSGMDIQLVTCVPIEDTSVNAYSAYTLDIPEDAFIYTGKNVLTYSLHNTPSWITLSGTKISGTPTSKVSGQNSITLQASDGTMTASQTFNVDVIYVNQPPVPKVDKLELSAVAGIAWSSDVGVDSLFEDSPDDTLSYAFTDLPTWLTEEDTVLSGTPSDSDIGTTTITLTATDQGGLSASLPIIITVIEGDGDV